MSHIKLLRALPVLILLVLLLAACGAPAATVTAAETAAPAAETAAPDGRTHVSTVDELLAAIAPNASIYLEDGEYELSASVDYGKAGNACYRWEDVGDGYELVITDVSDLSITAGLNSEKKPATSIVTSPRTANVLRFEDCENVSMFGVVLGHSQEPGVCSGGVVYLDNVDGALFEYCELYGCGTVGLIADGCEDATLQNSVIRHCTQGAVQVMRSEEVLVKLCEIYDCGEYILLDFDSSADCAVLNCNIYNNDVNALLSCGYSKNINLLGCSVKENTFATAAFCLTDTGGSVTVDGCEFADNDVSAWYGSLYEQESFRSAVDTDGRELDAAALESMVCEHIDWAPPEHDGTAVATGGEVRVSTVDELLAAIAPETTVYLENGTYDLSTASDYGAYGGKYYTWEETFDGPQLRISDVDGLTLKGGSAAEVTIAAAPRYANVIYFNDCDRLALTALTAGHTQEPGACAGGVVRLEDCDDVHIEACVLYGCGTIGVDANDCETILVKDTEIKECSAGGVWLYDCADAEFTNCNIHDINGSLFTVRESKNITRDGKPLSSADTGPVPMGGGEP